MQCSFWALRNILSPRSIAAWWQVCDILSSKFVWQLKWVPYYELKYTLWRKQQNKSHHIWSSFVCSNWISKIEPHSFVPIWTKYLNPEFQFWVLHFGSFYLSNQAGSPRLPLLVYPHTWLGCHRPSLAEPRPPIGARWSPDAPPPLHLRRQASFDWHRRSSSASSVLIHVRGLAHEFDEREGLTAKLLTHMNSG